MMQVVTALDWRSEEDVEDALIANGQTADQVFSGFVWLLNELKARDRNWRESDEAAQLAKASLERTVELISEAIDTDVEDIKCVFMLALKPAAWKWPVINTMPGQGGSAGDYREFSALKLFGYTVGKKGAAMGWDRQKRHKFLSDFMRLNLPPIVEELFPGEYGEPMTAHRLKKVADHISYQCGRRIRANADINRKAIKDWKEDLAFLKARFYEQEGLKFAQPWPDPEARS